MYTKTEDFVLVRIEYLSSTQIDWLVAKITHTKEYGRSSHPKLAIIRDGEFFSPSTNWGHAGPIIEKEHIGFLPDRHQYWACYSCGNTVGQRCYGNTALEATMKCLIRAKLGAEVFVPNF